MTIPLLTPAPEPIPDDHPCPEMLGAARAQLARAQAILRQVPNDWTRIRVEARELEKDAQRQLATITALDALTRDPEVARITGASNPAECFATLMTWKQRSDACLEATADLQALRARATSTERDSLLKQARAEGKVTPAEAEFWATMPMEALRQYLKNAQVKIPSGMIQQPVGAASLVSAKPYADMTSAERERLAASNIELFKLLRDEWIAAGSPPAANTDEVA